MYIHVYGILAPGFRYLNSTCSLFGQYLFKRVSDIKQREDKIRRKQQEDKARQEELKKGE